MRTLIAKAWPGFCRWRARRPCTRRAPGTLEVGIAERQRPPLTASLAADAGLTLLEVLVASLMVALIAVGTFSGFSAATKSSADSRAHAQATLLADQDEERLRGLTIADLDGLAEPTTTLRAENGDCLEEASGSVWHYWSKGSTEFCENPTGLSGTSYTGTVFSVTSTATPRTPSSSSSVSTCEATGHVAPYLQTSSAVTWTALGTRQPVTQSSIVSSPSATALLAKVLNQNEEPVAGANLTMASESPAETVNRTSPSSGCVVFAGLQATHVNVDASESGWINENGEASSTPVTVPLTSGQTTEKTLIIAKPGGIRVHFVNAANTSAAVPGLTFYTFNADSTATPNGYVGGSPATYATEATLAEVLFPFRNTSTKPTKPAEYTVFAGECENDSPEKLSTGAIKNPTIQVEPGATSSVAVPLSELSITVDTGTSSASPGTALSSPEKAMIINKSCEKATAREPATITYKHEAELASGKLVHPFQPFSSELELCIVMKKSASVYYKYEATFANTSTAGVKVGTVYMESQKKESTAPSCP
jgi:type II secretory pathway pseudopilin PulG